MKLRLNTKFILLAFVLMAVSCSKPQNQNLLDQHRNLGKAYYENPTTQQEAVREFQQALAIAPDSARDKLNYALALLKVQGREEEAIKLLQDVQRQDPALPHTWFNLGIYYKHQGDAKRAIAAIRGHARSNAGRGDRALSTGHALQPIEPSQVKRRLNSKKPPSWIRCSRPRGFSFTTWTGWPETPGKRTATSRDFQRIKTVQKSWVIPENVEWCNYAEIYDPPEARAEAATPPEPKFADTRLDGTVDPATAGLTLIDSTGSGQTDLLVWSSQGIRLFLKGQHPAAATGLEGLTGVIDVAPGDFDDDGRMDLCVLDGGRSGSLSQHRRQICPAARETSRPALRCRRMDGLRSRLRSRSHPARTAAGAHAESGSGGMGGSDRGFPVRERRSHLRARSCASFPTVKLSIWPCSTAIARRCCIAINWAADIR